MPHRALNTHIALQQHNQPLPHDKHTARKAPGAIVPRYQEEDLIRRRRNRAHLFHVVPLNQIHSKSQMLRQRQLVENHRHDHADHRRQVGHVNSQHYCYPIHRRDNSHLSGRNGSHRPDHPIHHHHRRKHPSWTTKIRPPSHRQMVRAQRAIKSKPQHQHQTHHKTPY